MEKRKALLSVYHKEGIADFARGLIGLGFELYASGGTAKHLIEEQVLVTDVAGLVGGEAILGHRVVTLSREVHAGLLAQHIDADISELEALGIPLIDLVCVDLYPLEQEIAKPEATIASVIEKTDIGGPTMLRSGVKGRRIVIADPADRETVLHWLQIGEPGREEFVNRLATKAEFIVAKYVAASATYHGHGDYEAMMGIKVRDCAYGENKSQVPAQVYRVPTIHPDPLAFDKFDQVEGSTTSYINNADLDRLTQTMTHIAAGFELNFGWVPNIAVGCKHGNACGVGVGTSFAEAGAMLRMIQGHPEALFGGCVETNFPLTAVLVDALLYSHMVGGRRALDAVIVPETTPEAVENLKRKHGKCRVFVNEALKDLGMESLDTSLRFRQLRRGFETQPNYTYILDLADERMSRTGQLSEERKLDMVLAWAIGCTSNSNTITLVRDGMFLGSGVGQVSRKLAAEVAVLVARDAGHDVAGAVAYSDSFFPFPDGPRVLANAGISAIFTTTGSMRDAEALQPFVDADVAVWSLPDEVARGFFGH